MKIKVEFLSEELEVKQITVRRTGEIMTMHEQKVAIFDPEEVYPTTGHCTLPKSRNGKAFPKGLHTVPLTCRKDNFGGLEYAIMWSQAQPIQKPAATVQKAA